MIKNYGSYIKEIVRLALPAVFEMILYMLIWVFDTMMVGKYGGQIAVSAVGLTSEIIRMAVNTIMGMGIGISMTSVVARGLGSGDIIKTKSYANQGLKLSLILSLIISGMFFVFSKNILNLAGAEGEILLKGSPYMKITSVATFFTMLSIVYNGIYRGSKNTKTPLYGALILNLTNLGLDYVLIFGKLGFPELGINGAGIATSIASVVTFIYLISQKKKLPFETTYLKKINITIIKDILRFSVPSSLQEGAYGIGRLLSVIIVMGLGAVSFSANQIAIAVESISIMPGWGFAVACTTLVGHSIGEKDYTKAREYGNISTILSSIIMGSIGIVFLLQAENIVGLFIKKEEIEVIRLGAICLQISCFQQIGISLGMNYSGAIKGSGDSKTPSKISFICNWGIRMTLVYYFLYLKRMPVTYFWMITALHWNIEGTIFFLMYRKRFKKLIKNNQIEN